MEVVSRTQGFPIGRRQILTLSVRAGLGLFLFGGLEKKAEAIVRVGDILPRVVLSDLKGNRVALPTDFQGRVAVLHFWASWCPACRTEMIALESLYTAYGRKGLVPCSIDVGEGPSSALSYLRDLKISYPVLLDPQSLTVRPFGLSGVPTFYFLDRQGALRLRVLGEADRAGLEKSIRMML